jgi:hypothetical protein
MQANEMDQFVRIPGVFRRFEIEQVLRPGCDFHIEPERLLPGTHLFTVYQQEVGGAASSSDSGAVLDDREGTQPAAASRPASEDLPQAREPSLGELKARHREEHLCLKCGHHLVCGMAKALDPNLLVTIASCLGFEPIATP